jgi:molecular chaperone GrpE
LAHETDRPSSAPDESGNGAVTNSDEVADDTSEPGQAAPEVDPLEAAQAESVRLKDQLLRTLADFDNFRKRTRREVADAEKRSRDELLRELLPVFDNLERAAQHAGTASEVKALADGIEMVMRQFFDTLSKLGVERVASKGQPFDPALHEAIQNVETSEVEPGTIVNEVQAGYRAGDRLVRPAMVVVAKAPR